MPIPHFEVPSGTVDGVNRVFVTSQPYQPLTTAVFLNGVLQERSLDNGWLETDPGAGALELKESPRILGNPDVVQVFYLDTSPVLPETEVCRISGILRSMSDLFGTVTSLDSWSGSLHATTAWSATALTQNVLEGKTDDVERLRGMIVEVCA